MRIACDALGGVAGRVDDDFHRGGDDADGVLVAFDVELAAGLEELHQVEAGEVAGGVVEEHVLRARIGGVDAVRVLGGVPAIDGGVVLHAGVAADPGGFGDLVHQLAGFEGLYGVLVLDGFRGELVVVEDSLHELVVHAHGVVGVLEEDRGKSFGVRAGAVIAGRHQRPGLLFFLHLALDEVFDIRVVDVEDDHLGGAAGLATGLDDTGEGVEAAHEAERAGSGAAAREGFHGAADLGQVRACARSPLEEHAFGLGEGQDAVEGILHGVDKAGGALRARVAGAREDGLRLRAVPVPVLGVGVGLKAVAAHVEPHRRIERSLLIDKQVGELVEEDVGVFSRGEVAVAQTPVADGFSDAADEIANTLFALGRAHFAVEVF